MRWMGILLGAVVALVLWLLFGASDTAPRASRPVDDAPREAPTTDPAGAPTGSNAPDALDRLAARFAELDAEPPPEDERPIEVEGRVVDTDGRPIEGATVTIAFPPVVTGTDGRFSVTLPPSDNRERRQVIVHHDDYLDWFGTRPIAEPVEVVLERGNSVAGRVTFPSGTPVPGWEVSGGRFAEFPAVRAARATTDDDGRFVLRGLGPGVDGRQMVVLSGGYASLRGLRGFDTTTMCETGATDVRIEFPESVLRVFVRTPGGEPPARASVELSARDGSYRNEANGPFRSPLLCCVPPGTEVELRAWVPGFRLVRRTIRAWSSEPSLHDEVVELERAGGDGGSAAIELDIWKPDGKRADEVVVEVVGTLRKETHADVGARILRLDDLEAGPVRLRIHADGESLLARELDVDAVAGEVEPVRIDLPKGARIRVPDVGVGVEIRVTPAGAKRSVDLRSIEDEKRGLIEYVTRSRVPDGEYEVRAESEGSVLFREVVRVEGEADVVVRAGK